MNNHVTCSLWKAQEKKVLESRVEKIGEIIKQMEKDNNELEERNNKNLKEELTYKTKIIFKKGVW